MLFSRGSSQPRIEPRSHALQVDSLPSEPSLLLVFPGGAGGKEQPANAGDIGDVGSIPGSGRSPGEGNGNLLQYSCLENSMNREAWWATVYWVEKSWT